MFDGIVVIFCLFVLFVSVMVGGVFVFIVLATAFDVGLFNWSFFYIIVLL